MAAEIGKLAERVASETGKISGRVRSMRVQVDGMSDAMQESNSAITRTTELGALASGSLEAIVNDVHETDAQTRLIEDAIKTITASIRLLGDTTRLVAETAQNSSNAIGGVQHGTDAVISAIKRIGQVTDETARNATSVSDSVIGQADDITRLSESAATLTALAGDLHETVGRFRVQDETCTDAGPIQLREYPRFRVDLPLIYVVNGRPGIRRGHARDLGGGGICFESDERLPENTATTLQFELQAGVKIEVSGRVVSTEHDSPHALHRHHLAFSGLSETLRDSILTYILEARRKALTTHSEMVRA